MYANRYPSGVGPTAAYDLEVGVAQAVDQPAADEEGHVAVVEQAALVGLGAGRSLKI
jgi:hypothetical protein